MPSDARRRSPGRPPRYPTWTDGSGIEQFAYRHPNYAVCDKIIRHLPKIDASFHDVTPIHPAWAAETWRFAYESAAEVGTRPSEHHLLGLKDRALGFVPGNLEWIEALRHTRKQRGVISFRVLALYDSSAVEREDVPPLPERPPTESERRLQQLMDDVLEGR